MRVPSLIAALVACIGLSTTSYAANVILNGDFSTGNFTGWTGFTTANGLVTSSVTSFDVTGSGASLAGTFNAGEQVFDGTIQGGGIFQFVNTGAGTGTFNMNIAANLNPPAASVSDGGTFSVLLDGVTETSFAAGSVFFNTPKRATLAFSAPVTAGSHEIEILITRTFLATSEISDYVDNISFDAPAPPSVPLPAALPLFASGLAGLGLLGWRRKKKAASLNA